MATNAVLKLTNVGTRKVIVIVILIASTVWFVAMTTVYKTTIFGGMQQTIVVKSQKVSIDFYIVFFSVLKHILEILIIVSPISFNFVTK